MCPVADRDVHHKVRKTRFEAGCYNRKADPVDPAPARTFTGEVYYPEPAICRQIGRKFNGAWVPLDECLGCKAAKDGQYIESARLAIDRESERFMKADQRI